MNILIIGHNYSTTLGIVRSIGKTGRKVDVMKQSKIKIWPELKSKYVNDVILFKKYSEDNLLKILDAYQKTKNGKTLIIPSDDKTAMFLDMNYEVLEPSFVIPRVKNTTGGLSAAMDKNYQKHIAKKCGLNVAEGWEICVNKQGMYEIPSNLCYPVFTKPQVSVGGSKSYIRKCSTLEELNSLFSEIAINNPGINILVEEYLPIENEYVLPGVRIDNRVVLPAFIKKMSIGSGAHKGVTEKGAVLHSKKFTDTKVQIERFISEIGLIGLFDIELIESNGNIYFNELNLRNGAANYGVFLAGVNLTEILVNSYEGKKIEDNYEIQFDGLIFVSEKVAFEEYLYRYSTWSEYREKIKSADVTLIKDDKDIKPYLFFVLLQILYIIKRIFKEKKWL